MNRDRYLLVISGPSGSGKDSVVAKLMGLHPGIECSVSATTRPPREDEMEGVHYFFLTREAFRQKIAQGDLIEYTEYVGNYYGTLKSQVDIRLDKKITCVLVIEVEGAANIKQFYPDCTTVFILPPSIEELERRLRKRGTEDEEWVHKRMMRAEEEMALANQYDYTLVNDDLDRCAADLFEILKQRQDDKE
ncbi:guanylate kinase [Ruminococcaceae bacterium OttesenSCG-928-I18]|nr:guanylate kinase [Ruminococcaceae bacterium OttesenSCG-928-I18]